MQEIIDCYGEFLLEMIVVGLLLINVFWGIEDNYGNHGVLQIIGKSLPEENVNHIEYIDFGKVYNEECNKDMPQIYFLGTHLKVGTNKVEDYFVAYDYEGKELPIILNLITDIKGTEVLDIYNEVLNEIYFSVTGIYVVEAETRDQENRVFRCKIQIPVCF